MLEAYTITVRYHNILYLVADYRHTTNNYRADHHHVLRLTSLWPVGAQARYWTSCGISVLSNFLHEEQSDISTWESGQIRSSWDKERPRLITWKCGAVWRIYSVQPLVYSSLVTAWSGSNEYGSLFDTPTLSFYLNPDTDIWNTILYTAKKVPTFIHTYLYSICYGLNNVRYNFFMISLLSPISIWSDKKSQTRSLGRRSSRSL